MKARKYDISESASFVWDWINKKQCVERRLANICVSVGWCLKSIAIVIHIFAIYMIAVLSFCRWSTVVRTANTDAPAIISRCPRDPRARSASVRTSYDPRLAVRSRTGRRARPRPHRRRSNDDAVDRPRCRRRPSRRSHRPCALLWCPSSALHHVSRRFRGGVLHIW